MTLYEEVAASAATKGIRDEILKVIWREVKAAIASRLDANADAVAFTFLFGLIKVRVKDIRGFIEAFFD